jgi:amino acid transporter
LAIALGEAERRRCVHGRGAMGADESSAEGGLRRDIGLIPLLFASLGAIIGSGWLFGALYASNFAGPAALFSWIFGGVVVILLALVHAELGAMVPVSGGSARYPHFSFGTLVGYAWGWITWLGAVTIAPIEAEAVLTYASNYIDGLTVREVAGGTTVILTPLGIAVAVILMIIFTFINFMGVKRFA